MLSPGGINHATQTEEKSSTGAMRLLAELTIAEGKLNEFKKSATTLIQTVDADEPNTLRYEWFIDDEGSKCYIFEVYKDSAAVLAHLANVGGGLESLFETCQLTQLQVFGIPSDELKQALEPFTPMLVSYWNGVAR